MITLKSCPICGSTLIARYHLKGFAPRVIHEIMPGVKVEADVVTFYSVCQDCHLIFQNPRLSDSELEIFYSQGYYRRTVGVTQEVGDAAEKFRAEIDSEIIKKHVGKITSHLDIGASRGYLLEAVGASIKVGIEPDAGCVDVKGVTIYPDMNQIPRKSFDLVTCIHTIEHVSCPLDYLQSMTKFIGKNGHLVIEVPTWKSPGGPLRLAHLYHFEPEVLKSMCFKAGLEVLHELSTPHLLLVCKKDSK